jgi:hypothetical protein
MVQLELFKVLAGTSAPYAVERRQILSVEITGEEVDLDMVGGILRLLAIQIIRIIQGLYNRKVTFSIDILRQYMIIPITFVLIDLRENVPLYTQTHLCTRVR